MLLIFNASLSRMKRERQSNHIYYIYTHFYSAKGDLNEVHKPVQLPVERIWVYNVYVTNERINQSCTKLF